MIEIAATSLLATSLLYLAVHTDRDKTRLKTLCINGQTKPDWRILAPKSWANRRVGLLNTVIMPEHFGLLISSSSVHTKGMLCSIDLIGLDQNGFVTQVFESAAPNISSFPVPKNTKQILEVATGTVHKLSIKLNDSVTFGDLV